MAIRNPGDYSIGYQGGVWRYPQGTPATAVRTYPGTPAAAGGGGGGGQAAPDLGWLGLLKNDPYAGLITSLGKLPTATPSAARTQVEATLKGLLGGISQDANVQQTQLRQQQTRASEFAKALAAMNMQAGQQVYGNYSDAAKTFAALGQGLTGAAAADWNAEAAKVQDAVSQMTGGRGGTIQGYDPNAMVNAQTIANVATPATTLEEQALRAGALTRAADAANVMSVRDVASQYAQKLADAQAQEVADKNKLLLQEPDLIQKALAGLKSDRQTQLANLAKVVGARQDWQTNVIQLQQKQESADAYNRYLNSKSTLSGQELAWKKKYEAGQLQVKRANARNAAVANALRGSGLEIQQGNLTIAQNKADAAITGYYTGADGKLHLAQGFYINPQTNKPEKQPPGTRLGKDGLPHYIPKPSTAQTNKNIPSYASIKDLSDGMNEGLLNRFNIFTQDLAQTPIQASHQQLVTYLMATYGKAFIQRYPAQKAEVTRQINALADTAVAWLRDWKKQNTRKKTTTTDTSGSPSADIGVGPGG